MRIVLFDLGDTLEHNDRLQPGATATLRALRDLRDSDGSPVVLALVSDFTMPASENQIAGLRREYLGLLKRLGIRRFFEPVAKRVTLSTEVGVFKPDRKIFQAVLDKLGDHVHFHDVVFVTENRGHVDAARSLGMSAIHLRGPAQPAGEVDQLSDLPQLVRRFLQFAPCCKKSSAAKGKFASQANKSKRANPTIAALTKKVNQDRLRATLTGMAEFRSRWSYSPNISRVPKWVRDQFVAAGYAAGTAVRYQPFSIPGHGAQKNVLCTHGNSSAGIILVCSHYDSISETPSSSAPGADDDATGVAACLELARLLRPVQLRRRVLFAAFGGEEQGLHGSAACAEIAAQQRWPIDVVINLDMIGYNPNGTQGAKIVVEYDQGNRNPGNDAAAKSFGLVMAQMAADYTSLRVEHTDIWNSDYMPFEAKGYACIGAYEGGDNPYYHKSTDTAEHVDLKYLSNVVRMVLATILTLAQ